MIKCFEFSPQIQMHGDLLQVSEEANGEQSPSRPTASSAPPTGVGMKGDEESGRSPAERHSSCCGMEPLLFFTLIGEYSGMSVLICNTIRLPHPHAFT